MKTLLKWPRMNKMYVTHRQLLYTSISRCLENSGMNK